MKINHVLLIGTLLVIALSSFGCQWESFVSAEQTHSGALTNTSDSTKEVIVKSHDGMQMEPMFLVGPNNVALVYYVPGDYKVYSRRRNSVEGMKYRGILTITHDDFATSVQTPNGELYCSGKKAI